MTVTDWVAWRLGNFRLVQSGDLPLETLMGNWSKFIWRNAVAIAALCVLWLCFQSAAVACPTCAEGMTNDANHANLVRGYFWSIVFMMSMPFLIFTALCSYFYIEVRRARARLARGGQYAVTIEV